MASFKNKIAQNRVKRESARQEKNFGDLKSTMQERMASEDYVGAMDIMAKMAANKKMDAEVMYWGALCYFRTGDYDRAARWVNNSLNLDNHRPSTKILLAALCFAQERCEDGLQLCQHVLSEAELSETDRDFLDEVLAPVRLRQYRLLEQYPAVSRYLESKPAAGGDAVSSQPEQLQDSDAQAVLTKLKKLLAKNRPEQDAVVGEQPAAPVAAEQPFAAQPAHTGFDAGAAIAEIAAREISLQEKITLLNSFAGACYQEDDHEAALTLLSAALELDACHAATLKNMAYVLLSAGDKQRAVEIAAKLPVFDFALLYALKQC